MAAARHVLHGGCQAVAQAIVDNGLADYYRNRDALPETRARGGAGDPRRPETLRSRGFPEEFRAHARASTSVKLR
jgi:hypothetical protein